MIAPTATAATFPVPVAVVTGALGSGKTTLIRDLMRRPEMEGTALVINEFGEVGLDHLMVSSAVETTLLMENGCLCCSLRGDLVDTVLGLFAAAERGDVPPFRRILIETTGLADPVPIVRDLSGAAALKGKVRLASVCTAVDGVLGLQALAADPVALAQVANADLCIVTKADLADSMSIDALKERLAVLNPLMRVAEAREGRAPPGDPLFDGARSAPPLPPEHHHGHRHHTSHGGVDTLSITLDHPLPWVTFRDWMDLVYSLHAARMLRLKGFLWVADREGPVLVQAVGPIVSPVELLREWPEGRRLTRLVMITKNMPAAALRRSFERYIVTSSSALSDAVPDRPPVSIHRT